MDTSVLRNVPRRRHTTLDLVSNCWTLHQRIIKQGYLIKLPDKSKFGSSFKKPVKRWFVFGVFGSDVPFMDYYSSEEDAFRGVPDGKIDIGQCLYILRNQKSSHNCENVFAIVMINKKLFLSSPNRTSMLEWCASLETHLNTFGVIHTINGKNDYNLVTPTRSRVSLFRPLRSYRPVLQPSTDSTTSTTTTTSATATTSATTTSATTTSAITTTSTTTITSTTQSASTSTIIKPNFLTESRPIVQSSSLLGSSEPNYVNQNFCRNEEASSEDRDSSDRFIYENTNDYLTGSEDYLTHHLHDTNLFSHVQS